MGDQSRFKFSVIDGVIELEGSEAFVSKHIDDLKDLIAQLTTRTSHHHSPKANALPVAQDETHVAHTVPSQGTPPQVATESASVSGATGIGDHPHTFEEMNGVLKVVADIPGATKKAKMTNAALLYGYGSAILGRETCSSDDIRQVCQDHGCLDSPNFAKVFDEKTLFVVAGVKGGKKTVKLTHLGRKQAKQLVDTLESNAG